ncbi:hypothetical protein [Limnohabitans sp. T6-20]|uniref:hypothetical protein n=1 Tax=Limnohabitans sp. T6-20 TaxID=1100725 RepID=UPI000D3CD450|nr:hypothetical protein [Limnohabitans sp. T6-20]PUE09932.1 hypothetical protein B9Z33_07315 [Limnohabitans sp. T6-20]
MREREKERIQRVKDAQKRLEEIKNRAREETVTNFVDGKVTTRTPLFSREVQALETLIERNQRWVTKPRKKKAPKLPPTGITTDSALFTDQMLAARWHCSTSRLQYWRSTDQGLPYLKMLGRVLYRIEDIQAYEQQSIVFPQTLKNQDNKPAKLGREHVQPDKTDSS